MDVVKRRSVFWSRGEGAKSENRFPIVKDGTFEGKYEKLEFVGRGSYGEVWKVLGNGSLIPLAAKMIDKSQAQDRSDSSSWRRVEDEIDVLRCLHHPNVITFWECFNETSRLVIVMELAEGKSLRDILNDGTEITEDVVRNYTFQILLGLTHLKEVGVVHRDLKPANIIVTESFTSIPEPKIKLIDFGFSYKVDTEVASMEMKSMENWCGTPYYASPQIFLRQPYNFKTDLWSLGVVVYELLSGGTRPFNKDPKAKDPLKSLMMSATNALFDFDEVLFRDVSDAAKDFICSLLVISEGRRFGPAECLSHVWMDGFSVPEPGPGLSKIEPGSELCKFASTGFMLDALDEFLLLAKSSKKTADGSILSSTKTRKILETV